MERAIAAFFQLLSSLRLYLEGKGGHFYERIDVIEEGQHIS